MRYYTYKITFKDLPGYFYYGSRKDNGKPYFGSPVTWAFLWVCFEPEVQVLQWYKTEREVRESEITIILATWKDKYSLNEAVGPRVSGGVCSKNGKKNGSKNVKSMLEGCDDFIEPVDNNSETVIVCENETNNNEKTEEDASTEQTVNQEEPKAQVG
jgi:hypothetical protein